VAHGCSCQGLFIAPDGTKILISSLDYTNVDGNRAYVQLPQACYEKEGQFTLAIKLIGNGITGTLRIVDGVVSNTGSEGAVAPTSAIPTYQEILALYDQMATLVGEVAGTNGEGNANQVDGYHAVDLLTSFNGSTRKRLEVRFWNAELEDDTETSITFQAPFTEEIVYLSAMPLNGFNVNSAISVVSMSKTGCVLKQKNGQGLAMNVRYLALGY
jgi:hypothetical protein